MALMSCGHDTSAQRLAHDGKVVCSGCANSGQRMMVATGAHRCHARNSRNERCTVVEHEFVTNKDGKHSIVHETKHSLWIVPVTLKVVPPLKE